MSRFVSLIQLPHSISQSYHAARPFCCILRRPRSRGTGGVAIQVVPTANAQKAQEARSCCNHRGGNISLLYCGSFSTLSLQFKASSAATTPKSDTSFSAKRGRFDSRFNVLDDDADLEDASVPMCWDEKDTTERNDGILMRRCDAVDVNSVVAVKCSCISTNCEHKSVQRGESVPVALLAFFAPSASTGVVKVNFLIRSVCYVQFYRCCCCRRPDLQLHQSFMRAPSAGARSDKETSGTGSPLWQQGQDR